MQHVLRCWKRQSDGSEYKKTFRRPGLRPGPHRGSLQHSRKTLVGGEGLAVPSPRTPTPRSRPFRPRLSYTHYQISSDADVSYDRWFQTTSLTSTHRRHQNNSPLHRLITMSHRNVAVGGASFVVVQMFACNRKLKGAPLCRPPGRRLGAAITGFTSIDC